MAEEEEKDDHRALGLTALVTVIVAALIVIWGLSKQSEYEWQSKQQNTENARHTQKDIDNGCASLPALARRDCAVKAHREQRDNERDEQDLVAQKTSALWTFLMGAAAILGVMLSTIGVWLVYNTFSETRRTANAAVSSAEAAKNAAKVAKDTLLHQREISQLQLRPWVGLDGVEIGRFEQGSLHGETIPYGVFGKLRFKNVGAIPAIKATAWTDHVVTALNATPPHFNCGEVPEGNSSIAPGKPTWGQTSMVTDVAESDALLAGQSNLWLYGIIRYSSPADPDAIFETEVCERILINGFQQTPTGPLLNIESGPHGSQNKMT